MTEKATDAPSTLRFARMRSKDVPGKGRRRFRLQFSRLGFLSDVVFALPFQIFHVSAFVCAEDLPGRDEGGFGM